MKNKHLHLNKESVILSQDLSAVGQNVNLLRVPWLLT